jgi:hypothetical protein
MNIKSRSALTFSELKNKTDEIYEFGNDWGLYIDIETNYQHYFREKKINKIINTLDRINENDEENYDLSNDNYNNNSNDIYNKNINNNTYYYRVKFFITKIIFYMLAALGLSFIFNNKKL